MGGRGERELESEVRDEIADQKISQRLAEMGIPSRGY